MGDFKKFRENRSSAAGRDREPVVLHRAACARCGSSCEVPFRPIGGRPVYCHNCFRLQKDSGNDRFSRRDFGGDDRGLKEQMELLNVKIDRLIKTVEAMASIKLPAPEGGKREDVKIAPAGESKKFRKSAKKVFKKNIRPF